MQLIGDLRARFRSASRETLVPFSILISLSPKSNFIGFTPSLILNTCSEVAMAILCLFKRSSSKWLLNLGKIPRNTARPGRSSFAKLDDRAGRLPPRACFPTLPPPSPKRAGEQDETVHGHRPFNLRCTTNLPWLLLLLLLRFTRWGR